MASGWHERRFGTTAVVNGLEGLAGQTNGTSIYFTRDPNGNLISMRQGAGGTSTNSYYLLDQQASVLRLTAADGVTDNATYAYDPYGVTLTATGTLAANNPYRYATGYYDTATGLYKLGQRYYNPSTGRFTQQDPAASGYAYAADDPANEMDPTGALPSVGQFEAVINSVFTAVSISLDTGLVGSLVLGALEGVVDTAVECGIFGCDGGVVFTLLKNVISSILDTIAFDKLEKIFVAKGGELTDAKIAEYLATQAKDLLDS